MEIVIALTLTVIMISGALEISDYFRKKNKASECLRLHRKHRDMYEQTGMEDHRLKSLSYLRQYINLTGNHEQTKY